MNAAQRHAIDTRRERVADLLIERHTYRQIAEELGVGASTITDDVKVIRKLWMQRITETFDTLVASQDADIERLMRAWMPTASDPAQGEDAARAALVVHRLMERRAKLLGLDAPIRAELTASRHAPEREAISLRERASRLAAEASAYLAGVQDAAGDGVIDVASSEPHRNGDG